MSFPSQTNHQFNAAELFNDAQLPRPEDFLSPEQRLDAIAEILATIGLRAMKEALDPKVNETGTV